MNKIGYVLSGGGIKGVAHVGVLQALKENNIEPDVIAGTSAGALVGAMYAKGKDSAAMLDFFKKTPLFKFSMFALAKVGLLDSEKFYPFFKEFFGDDSFESLHLPLWVMTTDIVNGRLRVFDSGQLIKPLLASSSIPLIFSPIHIEKSLYVDGGVINNFPVEPLLGTTEFIIGSNAVVTRPIANNHINSSFRMMVRTMDVCLYHANRKSHLCQYVFEPNTSSIGLLDTNGVQRAFDIGYAHAQQHMSELLQRMEQFQVA